MYKLPYFKAADPTFVINLVRQYPFAVLMGSNNQGFPVATQVPLFLEERENGNFLVGHIMRKTDHHKTFEENNNVMALFHGPHSYVSASSYVDPRQASTWNYLSVQASGKISFLDNKALVEILKMTTAAFEENQSVSSFDELKEDYVKENLHAIIAFEIKIEKLDHTFKLSQNKDEQTFQNILVHLEKGDEQSKEVAMHMRRNRINKL